MDDMDGEQETMAIQTDSDAIDGNVEGELFLNEDGVATSDVAPSSEPVGSTSSLADIDSTGLRSILKNASKGVSEDTHADYQRYGYYSYISCR